MAEELYAFNVSWHAGQNDPLFTVRAQTAEEFRERITLITEAWASITGDAPTEVVPSADAPPPAPKAKPNVPLVKLPKEALEALTAQKRGLCVCQDKWWDNRETKQNLKAPDFKCVKCGYGVWLTPPKGVDE